MADSDKDSKKDTKNKWSLLKPISSNQTLHDLYFEDRHIGTLEIKDFNAEALVKILNENQRLIEALKKAKKEIKGYYKVGAKTLIKVDDVDADAMFEIHCNEHPLMKEINELLKDK